MNCYNTYRKLVLLILILVFSFQTRILAQISSGGRPLNLNLARIIRSDFQYKHTMPSIPKASIESYKVSNIQSKCLTFGHIFNVNFTPANSGITYQTNHFNVWKMEVVSKGAFSINLLFDQFKIPQGARLFIFNEDKTRVLGAFTHKNNKESKILAIQPLPGDHLILQYEEPISAQFSGELVLGKVVHAFMDVVNDKNVFNPRRKSGYCNIDVNCEIPEYLKDVKRATCRVFVINKLGTATLLNNTAEDGTPYLISAYHVFDNMSNSESALFSFNYESPGCTGIEGSDFQSISGAKSLAGRKETDVILVQLSETPPPSFRTYYAGWDRRIMKPSDSYTIHHPNGDTKKISHDVNTCDSATYSDVTLPYAHWKIKNWESGTTEFGSSGAGLFNTKGNLVGTLSGGAASCTNIDFDMFARIDKMYDHYSLINSQLKHWLDPLNSNIKYLAGKDYHAENEINCSTFSNLPKINQALVYTIDQSEITGNNSLGISEIAESFNQVENGILTGFYVGISNLVPTSLSPKLTYKIYQTTLNENNLLYEQSVPYSRLLKNAYNSITLDSNLYVENLFFISFELSNNEDSISFFHSELIPDTAQTTFFYQQNDVWKASNLIFEDQQTAKLMVTPNICRFELKTNSTFTNNSPTIQIFPNPANNWVQLKFNTHQRYTVKLFTLNGCSIDLNLTYKDQICLLPTSTLESGIYVLKISDGEMVHTQKIVIQHP